MTSRSEYMVSVDGRSAPSKTHANCPEAMVEAERLAKQPGNSGAVIRVLQVVKVLRPVHVWDYMADDKPADPCPGCRPGVTCRTPSCGRLKFPGAF